MKNIHAAVMFFRGKSKSMLGWSDASVLNASSKPSLAQSNINWRIAGRPCMICEHVARYILSSLLIQRMFGIWSLEMLRDLSRLISREKIWFVWRGNSLRHLALCNALAGFVHGEYGGCKGSKSYSKRMGATFLTCWRKWEKRGWTYLAIRSLWVF